eukprot:6356773-Amphidinium_carterae.1
MWYLRTKLQATLLPCLSDWVLEYRHSAVAALLSNLRVEDVLGHALNVILGYSQAEDWSCLPC